MLLSIPLPPDVSPNPFALAVRFHQAGALAQAEQLYRRTLQEAGEGPDVWFRLGEVYQALARRADAEASYRQTLRLDPGHIGAHNNLGIVLMEQGRLEEAAACYRQALQLRPEFAEAHNNLGIALMDQGQLGSALVHYEQALRLKPDYPEAYNNRGNALARQQRWPEAVGSYRRAVELNPSYAQAHVNLGNALRSQGRRDEAAASYGRALQLEPGRADTHNELGITLMEQGKFAEAIACYRRALELRPDFASAYNNLGIALVDTGRADEAVTCYQQALYLQSDFAVAHNNLGLALAAQGRPDEARACYERALEISPDYADALNNLGNAHKDQGSLDEAIACYRRALDLKPDDAPIHSNLLFTLLYHPAYSPEEVFREHERYGRIHGSAPAEVEQPRPAGRARGGRLRVGYVSPDFRDHVVAYFLEPILAAHDRGGFEILCYANVPRPDAVTDRLRRYADGWRSLVGLSDAGAAELIRRDEVDVLVELAGHTAGNRLPVFARRPAPVQVTYLGYIGTTGLPAVDYRVTDVYADPPGLTERYHSERLVRLPETALCYRPGPSPDPAPAPPARQDGRVTFGSLNNLAKVSDEVLGLWARVLAAVPGSRLLLKAAPASPAVGRARQALERHGVGGERLILVDRTGTRHEYLELYDRVDVALDPFPYNGITTTCDALWMGVPVVALAGRTPVARQGVSLLSNVGLRSLVAASPADYVAVAARLAGDLAQLAAWRSGLRGRMSRCPLMAPERLTRRLEAAYRRLAEGPR
jgi:predicted O-linked N-acetylglucosamine transferase (SPINDLY family)